MRIAIIIGCNEYDDPTISSLKYAVADADAVSEILQSSCDFSSENILRLYRSNNTSKHQAPTRANIIRTFTEVRRKFHGTGPELLAFFFSGHGFHSNIESSDYLITEDSVIGELEATALSFPQIERYFHEVNAKHTIIFLDACRAIVQSGKSAIPQAEILPFSAHANVPAGMISFFSCKPGQSSYEADICNQGIFTHCLLQALGPEGRCATVYEVNNFLVQHLPRISHEMGRPTQDPYTRVEPLDAQYLRLVSTARFLEWRSDVPIGQELRSPTSNLIVPDAARKARPIFSLDFGTTRSALGVADRSGEEVAFWFPGSVALVPTVIAFDEVLNYEVGARALASLGNESKIVIRNFKRLLGTDHVFNVFGRSLTAEFLATLVIRSLKNNVEEAIGSPVERVIASCPVGFTARQMNALANAINDAGLTIERLVAEPCAATYLLDIYSKTFKMARQGGNKLGLFIDLGGGTLDVAVLDVGDGVIEILGTDGDRHLGSADYDNAIFEMLLQDIAVKEAEDSGSWKIDLLLEAERAKIDLGSRDQTSVVLRDVPVTNGNMKDIIVNFNRDTFREISKALDDRFEAAIGRVLHSISESESWRGDLVYVFLTGQGSKIVTVREAISKNFPNLPIIDNFQQDAVIKGLCLYATLVDGTWRESLLLLNLVRRAIGVRYETKTRIDVDKDILIINTAGNDEFATVIDKGTYPSKKSCLLRLNLSKNNKIKIEIFEKEVDGRVNFDVINNVDEIQIEDDRKRMLDFKMDVDIDAGGAIAVSFKEISTPDDGPENIESYEFRLSKASLYKNYKGLREVGKQCQVNNTKWIIQRGEIFR